MKAVPKRDYKLFSIVIASYNHDKYVIECLNSIKAQNYPYIELIVIDDCSTDTTYQLECEWFEENREKFHNIILLKNDENRGVVKTMNRGLEICTGDYILRFASDDCLLVDAVKKIVSVYSENPECGMICFDGIVGEDFNSISHYLSMKQTIYSEIDYNQLESPFEELYKRDYIAAPGCIVKRETYLQIGLCDANIAIEDWEYWLRVMRSMPVLFSKEKIVFYRQLKDSLSKSPSIEKRKMMNQCALYVLEKYKNDIPRRAAKKVMSVKTSIVLREVLEWREPEYLAYVMDYIKRNNIRLTVRAYIKLLIYKLHCCG